VPTLLITGANRGIGLELTRLYAADGWTIHACCRYPDKAAALKALDGEILLHRLDVTDGLRVASFARELSGERIDLLINNAGIYGPRTGFGETDYDEWLSVLKTNTLAPLRMAERFADHVVRSDRKCIAMISSIMGSVGSNSSGGAYIYRSSKAALNAVSKSLSVDLAERGITVVMFHPGWVQTDMGGSGADIDAETSAAGIHGVLGRVTTQDNGHFFNYDGTKLPW